MGGEKVGGREKGWMGKRQGLTADDDGHGAVGAHGDEEEGRVLEVVVGVLSEEDGEAGDGDGDGEEGEEEAVAEAVGGEGDEHGEGEGGGPGGDGVELRLDGGVAVGADDAGGEEGVACGDGWVVSGWVWVMGKGVDGGGWRVEGKVP